jgi:NADH-quinone oxidoreductase subunit G
VRNAGCVIISGADLLAEAPMMALAVRQAWRNGAEIHASGGADAGRLAALLGITVSAEDSLIYTSLEGVTNPVLICGAGWRESAVLASVVQRGVKVAALSSGPNGVGAALLTREHGGTSLQEAAASGRLKGIIAVEADIPVDLRAGITLLAIADWLPAGSAVPVDIFLPTTAWVEMDGTYVNFEGRAQRFTKVMSPGLPIKGLDSALHPPRVHRVAPPGGDPRPAWRILAELIERLGGDRVDDPFTGRWAGLCDLDPEGEGRVVV